MHQIQNMKVLPVLPVKYILLDNFKKNRDPKWSWRYDLSCYSKWFKWYLPKFLLRRSRVLVGPRSTTYLFLCSLWSLIISWALHQEPQIYRSMAINKTQIELGAGAQQTDYRVFTQPRAIGRQSLSWKKGHWPAEVRHIKQIGQQRFGRVTQKDDRNRPRVTIRKIWCVSACVCLCA